MKILDAKILKLLVHGIRADNVNMKWRISNRWLVQAQIIFYGSVRTIQKKNCKEAICKLTYENYYDLGKLILCTRYTLISDLYLISVFAVKI